MKKESTTNEQNVEESTNQSELFPEKDAETALKMGYAEAEKIINNEDKLEKFLRKLEIKIKELPMLSVLSYVPIMGQMINCYAKKKYTELPLESIICAASALLYTIMPIDLIPDWIPYIGYFDDIGVIAVCLKFIKKDLDKFVKWRDENEKTFAEGNLVRI